jgi:hypothetical protein
MNYLYELWNLYKMIFGYGVTLLWLSNCWLEDYNNKKKKTIATSNKFVDGKTCQEKNSDEIINEIEKSN